MIEPNEKTQEMYNKVIVGIQTFEHRGYRIPNHMAGGLARYFVYGLITGDFLQAVMRNDFMAAYDLADEHNTANMAAYPAYLYNAAPSGSYGSQENVDAWIASGGLAGQ